MTSLINPQHDATSLEAQSPAVALLLQRLTTPGLAEYCAEKAQDQAETFNGWEASSLYAGTLGTAMVMLAASRTDSSWASPARELLAEAFSGSTPLAPNGLASSASSALAVLALFADTDPRYLPALQRQLDRIPEWRLGEDSPNGQRGVSFEHYDLVSGTAGTALSLSVVARLHPALAGERLATPLAGVARQLRDWVRPTGPDGSPAAWIAAVPSDLDDLAQRYPDGHLNLGLSHGLAGVLSAAAAIHEALPGCSDAAEAVELTGTLVEDRAQRDGDAVRWPSTVPRPGGRDEGNTPAPDRMVWCYGAAGMAAALARAAQIPGQDHLILLARDAARTVATRYLEADARPSSPTICHGLAGILVTLDSVRRVLDEDTVSRAVSAMRADLADLIDPGLPLGIQDREATTGNPVDDPAVLTGSSGVALALLSTAEPERPAWYPLMGL